MVFGESEEIAVYYGVSGSDKLQLKIRKSWVQFLFGRFLFFFAFSQSMLKEQNQYPGRVRQLTIHYMCVFLSDNAILVSHFSCQLLLREGKKKIKGKKRKAGIDKKTEIYPTYQVEWKLTGFLMLHAQNKKDSCSAPV